MARVLASLFAFWIGILAAAPSQAQVDNDAYMELLYEVAEIVNKVNQDTARESHQACMTYLRKIDGLADLDDLQRTYLRAQAAGCIAYAMNNGEFSDATGDQCSWQHDYAKLLVETLAVPNDRPGVAEAKATIQGDLEQAIRTAGMMNCKQDFEALNKQP